MKLKRTIFLSLFIALNSLGSISQAQNKKSVDEKNISKHFGRNGKLNSKERNIANIAWKFFENNYQPETGLVNAVDGYPSTTMWDTASYLGALVSAYELDIIDKNMLDIRLSTLFKTFNKMELFRNELPNKAYNTRTGQKVNYANKPGEIGYSALDLGRLLIWFKIIKERYPQHSNAIDNILLKWSYCKVLDDEGTMYGATVNKDKSVSYLQEGRLGYEEYAAKGFQLWGFKTDKASKIEPFETISIFGLDIPYDNRDPRKLGAHNYVVSESYILDGIEINWDNYNDKSNNDSYHSDSKTAEFAQTIYKVQEKRFENTGILTARTEHQLDKAPYFVYDTIYTDGYSWNTITDTGKYVPEFSAVALKAALGLWVLWETEYTNLLFDRVSDLNDPEKGFYEGAYENGNGFIKTFTANNNGIMLEILLYKVQGKLLKFSNKDNIWDKTMNDSFFNKKTKCFP